MSTSKYAKAKYVLGLSTILSLPIAAQATQTQPIDETALTARNALTYNQKSSPQHDTSYISISSTAQRPNYGAPYNHMPTSTQTQRITAEIGQSKSNWFWNASTSVAQQNQPYRAHKYVDFSRVNRSNFEHKYIRFPSLITTGVPILGEALEKSLNKAVHKRLTKTAEQYARVEAFNRLQKYAEELQSANPELYALTTDVTETQHLARFDRALFNHAAIAPRPLNMSLSSFDNTIHHNMQSVLDYYHAASDLSGVRLRGEIGYKTNSVQWRMGIQKQKIDGFRNSMEQQERKSIYSTANWDISERLNYFHVFTRERFENRFGLEGFSHESSAQYHRLSYAVNENTHLFIGKGRLHDDLIGNAERYHSGVQNCTELQKTWDICSSLSYQKTSYAEADSEIMRGKNGVQAALTAKIRF
jgi:hypothetical protein